MDCAKGQSNERDRSNQIPLLETKINGQETTKKNRMYSAHI